MSASHIVPENPSEIEWDVAVIGTGMGGAVAGYALAKLGRRGLFIEKSLFIHGDFLANKDGREKLDENLLAGLADNSNEDPESRLRAGLWPLPLQGRTS